MAKLHLYVASRFAAVATIHQSLELPDGVEDVELSTVGWKDQETVMDELVTFFPLPKQFDRQWESLAQHLATELDKREGHLIVLRCLDHESSSLEPISRLADVLSSLYSRTPPPRHSVWLVLDKSRACSTATGLPSAEQEGKFYPLQQLDLVQHDEVEPTNKYSVQVSAKRSHTYYVNLALKIFQRRDWYSLIEFSGLGKAIPSIVSIAEILKRYQVAELQSIKTSMVELKDTSLYSSQKAKMLIILAKIAVFPQINVEQAGEQVA
ncbi:hypothetical protein QOT17_014893 [Balamuthia mandrillaris]